METKKRILLVVVVLLIGNTAEAQFWKKVKKAVKRGVENTVERRTEKESEKETDKALDKIFKKEGNTKNKKQGTVKQESEITENQEENTIKSKFGFTPGSSIVFQDRFEKDEVGDFPAKWETNGTGEITEINGMKYLKMANNSLYVPMLRNKLPENYTVEFDLFTENLTKKTSSQSWIYLQIDDNNQFKNGKEYALIKLNPVQFIEPQTWVYKYQGGKQLFSNHLIVDYRNIIKGKVRISMTVNKSRWRIWMNTTKVVDVPTIIPKGNTGYLKMMVKGLKDENIYIGNVRIAITGTDKRHSLLEKGTFTTNDILFESGKSVLKPSSNRIIEEIVKALNQVPDKVCQIIGHTDSDGDENTNLKLSTERANSVKERMMEYGIANPARLIATGSGESQPIASNNTPEGKTKNRRVEFKIYK